jgi:hypothetical protein
MLANGDISLTSALVFIQVLLKTSRLVGWLPRASLLIFLLLSLLTEAESSAQPNSKIVGLTGTDSASYVITYGDGTEDQIDLHWSVDLQFVTFEISPSGNSFTSHQATFNGNFHTWGTATRTSSNGQLITSKNFDRDQQITAGTPYPVETSFNHDMTLEHLEFALRSSTSPYVYRLDYKPGIGRSTIWTRLATPFIYDQLTESNPITLELKRVPSIEITKIWSDQFSGVIANFLPADGKFGAGERGNLDKYILMGARQDGLAYVKARVAVSSLNAGDSIPLEARLSRVADSDVVVISSQTSWEGDVVSFVFDPTEGVELNPLNVSRFRITAWLDFNGNGILDLNQGEIEVRAPGDFRVISKARYDWSRLVVNGELFVAWLMKYRIGNAFYRAFIDNKAPEFLTDRNISSVCASGELSHNIGVAFESDLCGPIPTYRFDQESIVGLAILRSYALRKIVARAVQEKHAEILQGFRDSPGLLFQRLDLMSSAINFEEEDPDLKLSIHTAQLQQLSVIIDSLDQNSVTVVGNLNDLYDFDFDAGTGPAAQYLDPLGASIQAGYGTLGSGGQVFRITADFYGTVEGIRYDGALALSLNLSNESTGATLQIYGPPGTAIDIETSSDLENWEQISSRILTNASDWLSIPEAAPSSTISKTAFFRLKQR